MLPHVGAKAGWGAIERYLLYETALHQEAQAIVNRGERNFRHPLLRAMENFLSSWVILALSHNLENLLALAGKAEPACREFTFETILPVLFWNCWFNQFELTCGTIPVNEIGHPIQLLSIT